MAKNFTKVELKEQLKLNNDLHDKITKIKNETTGVVNDWATIRTFIKDVAAEKRHNFYKEKWYFVFKTEQSV